MTTTKSHLCLFFLFFSIIDSTISCPLKHKQALLHFKTLLILPKPTNNSSNPPPPPPISSPFDSWNADVTSSNCCQWERVSCYYSGGGGGGGGLHQQHIIALKLNDILPFLPPNSIINSTSLIPLFCIKTLRVLHISNNQIHGPIPPQISHVRYLQQLDLSNNNFFGEIPETLGKLNQLSLLDVSNNQLVGEIPVSGKMITMNEPRYFANNSGLCGRQIQVPCPTTTRKPRDSPSDSEESCFSWYGVAFGYPIGLFIGMTSGYRYLIPEPRIGK